MIWVNWQPNIDEIVRLIKSSKDPEEAKTRLIDIYSLSEKQAKGILDMRLQRLTSLEVDKIINELKELMEKIKQFQAILENYDMQSDIIRTELEEIASAQGVTVEPGDALIVHSGWESYTQSAAGDGLGGPGLHPSCAEFIRDHDVSLLGWDLMDAGLGATDLAWPVHGVLFNFGVALLDNALLEPIADACAEEGRHEFMFMGLPLNVARGTGSPANPVAMFQLILTIRSSRCTCRLRNNWSVFQA